MSDIAPIGRPNLTGINGSGHRPDRLNGHAAGPKRDADRVELSTTAQFLSKLKDLPDVREDLVARVRAQIAAGTYDTEQRVDATIDALAEDLR